jgi:hypothetical protein
MAWLSRVRSLINFPAGTIWLITKRHMVFPKSSYEFLPGPLKWLALSFISERTVVKEGKLIENTNV